jgi:chaperonin GroEL
MDYAKVKSVAKRVEVEGPVLDAIVLDTMAKIGKAVGGTLGPGGKPVLIERYEHDLPPFLTKDGVTVFRSLGFDDPIAHCVMEVSRDASVRTANEAGDGTTTATILSEAIVRLTKKYCKENQRVSPQRVVRHLERTFRDVIEPAITGMSRSLDLDVDQDLLRSIAQVSANGDSDLADAVMECFEVTGDQGNVTIIEEGGPSHYEVEHIQGFPISMGYEESCKKFYPKFINDPGTQRTVLEDPAFLLYHGRVNEIRDLVPIIEQAMSAFQNPNAYGLSKPFVPHLVIVATGFSEGVLATCATNFDDPRAPNIFPLLVPNNSPQSNAQFEFLRDLAGITGATLCDPISKPLTTVKLEDLGVGCEQFEVSRSRSNVVGFADEGALQMRLEEVEQQLQNPDSELDGMLLKERIAKLSGGIARLKVIGSSNGELKEKRDRAEDAVCAVRGAVKHGCLPGGAWMLIKLWVELPDNPINNAILRPACLAPFMRLVENSGFLTDEEGFALLNPILEGIAAGKPVVYDFLESKHVDPYSGGILDSTPAVLEAVRNAISSASQIGTMGACVVYARDTELERSEAKATANFLRDANSNPADERA